MQDKKSKNLDFTKRTDALAKRLGCNLIDLPDALGISKALLFAARTNSPPPSLKTWNKLEQAEKLAGIYDHDEKHHKPVPESPHAASGDMLGSIKRYLDSTTIIQERISGLIEVGEPWAIRQAIELMEEHKSHFILADAMAESLMKGLTHFFPDEVEKVLGQQKSTKEKK